MKTENKITSKETQLSITDNPDEADTIIVNTCGFLDIAREESIETILQLPENNNSINKKEVPIIITTHETTISLLNKAIIKAGGDPKASEVQVNSISELP